MQIEGKRRRELHVEPTRAPWLDAQNRVVGVHRQVRITVVGTEVGAWNAFSESLTAADLRRLADWLEQAAFGDNDAVELGGGDERLRLTCAGSGSVVVELRGELRPWCSEESTGVARFELEVEPEALRKAARDLRTEVKAWLE
jgi:hypothetical protein